MTDRELVEFTIYCTGRGCHGRLDLFAVWLRDGKLYGDSGHKRAHRWQCFKENTIMTGSKTPSSAPGFGRSSNPAPNWSFMVALNGACSARSALIDR